MVPPPSSSSPRGTRLFRPKRGPGRSAGRNRPATPVEKVATWAVVALAGVGGAVAGCRPTGWRASDIALTGLFAALVSLAGSRGRRWSWLIAAGVGAVLATAGIAVACGVAAVVIAFAAAVLERRSPVVGALVAGLAVQALLRLPDFGFHGAPSLVAAVAVVPLLDSGYRYASRGERKTTRRVVAVVGGLTIVLGVLVGVAALSARNRIERAIARAEEGFDAVREGEHDAAITRLDDAAADFEGVTDLLGSWWMRPARVLPVAGQQVVAVEAMAEEGARLASVAADAATEVDYENLRVKGGAIDLDLLQQAQGPIQDAAEALSIASRQLDGLAADWLLPPLRTRYDRLRAEVARALPAADLAADVVAVAPALLGGEGPRHYLVLFGTPSESRALGGFVGNYAEVTAENGKLSLTRSGRGLDLSDPSGELGWTLEEGDYLERFDGFQVNRFFGNVSASPDFGEVAHVAEQLYPQATGVTADGVFYMDPYTIARFIGLTGPIRLKDAGIRLTEDNAAEYLLKEQYVDLDEREDRVDFLDEATREMFEELTSGDLPSPQASWPTR